MDRMAPWVLHVDMDQFIAAVEVLRHPELAGLPVIVGGRGDPTERGVVSTASYEARAFGVRSGMPLRTAVRRCPEAVVLPVDKPAYDAASAVVMDTLRAVPGAVVEVLGWDEAFVGVEADDPEAVARRIQADVLAATRLHCSVGIGDTKVRAKIATEFGKPRGTFRLTRDNWFEVMGDRPTGDLWGVGPRISQRLAALGIDDGARAGRGRRRPAGSGVRPADRPVARRARPWREQLDRRRHPVGAAGARPRDDLPAATSSPPRSRTPCGCSPRRWSTTSAAEGRPCARVHLKVRFAPFFTVNRSRKLAEPTWDAGVIADTALDLYRALDDERPVRLLGVRAEMVPPEGGYEPPRTHGRRGMP